MKMKSVLIGVVVGLVIFSSIGVGSGEIIVAAGGWNFSNGTYGNVYLLPFYSEGKDTNIICSNDTFNTSTTADDTGYYIFENLIAGFYWINATLYSYKDNNVLVEVISGWNETLLSSGDAL